MFEYDAAGNLVKAVDALGGVATYEYDSFHRITKQTDARGYYYSFKYDVWGRCVRAGGMDGLWACRVEYFPEQGFTRYTEGEDATWEFHYEKDGFVTKIVDPYGGVKRRERDEHGRVVREVDSGERSIQWLYDANGCHHARVDEYGHLFPPELEQPRLPNPFRRSLPATTYERQLAGLVRKPPPSAWLGGAPMLLGAVPVELAAWARARFRVRPPGSLPDAPERRLERDALGRITRETDAWGRHREWRYDATGNILARRDRDGSTTEYQTTSWNLVGTKRDGLGHERGYRYSSLEQVIGFTDPLGNTTRYDYDLKKRLVRIHRHGRIKEEYVYDEGDHFVEKLDGNSNVIFRSELHRNHRVAKRILTSGGHHVFDYDARGRVTEASTNAHEVRLGYDHTGSCSYDFRDGRGVRHQRKIDRGGARLQRHVLERFVTNEESHGGHATITSPAGGQTTLRWDESGMVARHTCAGTVEVSQYDHEGRLENQVVCRRSGDTWQAISLHYAYSAGGDLLSVGDSSRGTTVYEVDAAHRLLGELTPERRRLVYELDAAGNVVTKPGLQRAEFASGNRISATEDEEFSFDDRNHIALRRSRDGDTTRYVYDSVDMLVRIEKTLADGAPLLTLAYEYDALDRRLTVRGATTRDFYWEGDRLAAEILPDGKFRVYDYAGREALVPIGFTDFASADADPSTGYAYATFSNSLGMPSHIEDASGRIVWWATRIDPYGTIDVHPESRVEYNLRWPGHYYDPETGLHYNRHRYYDPRLGRYLQSDPLGYGGSEVNLYAYAPNPLVQVDLLGLQYNKPQPPNGDGNPQKQEDVVNSSPNASDGATEGDSDDASTGNGDDADTGNGDDAEEDSDGTDPAPVGPTDGGVAETAASVRDKLDRYLLNPDHPDGRSKAKWFEQALGFTRENADDLASQIVFDPRTAVETAVTPHGTKFNQIISITGANGKTIDVPFAWIRNNDGIIRLVTSIPAKK